MHDLEPYFNWRHEYISSEDAHSPFFNREYSEFEFTHVIYNYCIHPQWDDMGSPTLFLKILYVDYEEGFTIIELLGEWNDCINNDVMIFKRDVAEILMLQGVNKFILIGENVLNFHCSDDCYYEEWFDDVEDGWIAGINFREHVIEEFRQANIDYYISFGGQLDDLNWRTFKPNLLFEKVDSIIARRLGV